MAFGAATPNHQTDTVETSKGPLKITPLFHGSVMLEFDGKVIHIDPWSQADYTGVPKADLIVITHTHADHMDAALLKTLRKESTILVGPPAVTDTLNGTVGDTDALKTMPLWAIVASDEDPSKKVASYPVCSGATLLVSAVNLERSCVLLPPSLTHL